MSYILDALRRADAERERGRVPGLHAQATPLQDSGFTTAPPHQSAARPKARLITWLAVPIVAGVGALAWWTWNTSEVATPAAPSTVSAASAPASPTASVNPQTTPIARAPADAKPPAPPPASPILAPSPPAAAAPPLVPAVQAPTPPKQPPDRPANASGTSADPGALPRVTDLPADARGGLPPLKVSGVTYADNAALRMLIIDGQVIQEGQDIAAGLTLESIGPRSAVLNQRGRRLRLTY